MRTRTLYPFILTCSFFLLQISVSWAQRLSIDSLLNNIPAVQDTFYVHHISEICKTHPNIDSALVYCLEAYQKAKAFDMRLEMGNISYALGVTYRLKDSIDTAMRYFERSKEEYEAINAIVKKSGAMIEIGGIYARRYQTQESLKRYYEALEVAEEAGAVYYIGRVHHRIGDFYRIQQNVDRAIYHFDKAKACMDEVGNERKSCAIDYLKATTYKISKDSLLKQRGIEMLRAYMDGTCWEISSDYQKGIVLTSLGSMLVFDEKYEEGEELLLTGLAIKQQNGFTGSIAYSLNELCTMYLNLEDYEEAIKYGEQALAIAEQRDDLSNHYDVLNMLSKAYYKSGYYKKGYELQKNSLDMRDTVMSLEREASLVELETKYKVAVKEEELAKKDLEIAQQSNRFNRLGLIALIIAVVLGTLFLWMRYRLSRRAMETQQMKELDHLRSAFFTNISHEFRTPLSLIIAPLRKLKKEYEERQRYYGDGDEKSALLSIEVEEVHRMERNANRLENLINQLLDLSKMDAGKTALRVREQDLAEFTQQVVSPFDIVARQKKIELQCACFTEPLEAFFDADVVEKILTNLISNALKYTEHQGKVKVLLNEKDGMAIWTVSDTGKGISQNDLVHIFDRFYQANTAETANWNDASTGIGLALVKELVSLHKGSIKVSSLLGKGTTFQVLLPMGQEHYDTKEIIPAGEVMTPTTNISQFLLDVLDVPEEKADVLAKTTNLATVLVVEDNKDLNHYLQESLRSNYVVLTAENGQEGLNLAIEKIPDLIISDVMMPVLDGMELCETLKKDERTSHIPIILLTAKATKEEIVEGLKKQADEYLTKPFDEELLLLKIKNLIEQRQNLKLRFAKKVELRPHELNVSSQEEAFLKKVMDVIEQNMSNTDFSVEQLSHNIGMSRTQLFRKLKALTGETPTIFIRNIRLRRAKALLEQQHGTVNEIAYMVGFANSTYFFKCFKDMYGQTPKEASKGVK